MQFQHVIRDKIRILTLIVLISYPSGSNGNNDHHIEVAFILNFCRFIIWPSEKLPEAAQLNICIMQTNDVFASYVDMLQGKEVQGHSVNVINLASDYKNIAQCHVAYISYLSGVNMMDFLSKIKHQSILSISNKTYFVEDGGMIGIVESEGRYRFDINLRAIRSEDLYIGTNVLSLARKII